MLLKVGLQAPQLPSKKLLTKLVNILGPGVWRTSLEARLAVGETVQTGDAVLFVAAGGVARAAMIQGLYEHDGAPLALVEAWAGGTLGELHSVWDASSPERLVIGLETILGACIHTVNGRTAPLLHSPRMEPRARALRDR